jgi:hypothetical protein
MVGRPFLAQLQTPPERQLVTRQPEERELSGSEKQSGGIVNRAVDVFALRANGLAVRRYLPWRSETLNGTWLENLKLPHPASLTRGEESVYGAALRAPSELAGMNCQWQRIFSQISRTSRH